MRSTVAKRSSRRTSAGNRDLAQVIANELRAKYPDPVKKSSGTKIWEDAKYAALPEVGKFTAEELLTAADLAMYRITHQGTNWTRAMDLLKHYDDDFFHEGLRGVLVGVVADSIADETQRLLTQTSEEAAEYDYYS